MGSMFGKSKDAKGKGRKPPRGEVTAKDRAELELKVARDKIRRFIKKCEKEDASFVERARTLIKAKKKQKAMMVLKLRKYRAAQAAKADGQLLNLQQMISDIQYQELQADVVAGLEQGNTVLKELTAACSLERVELLMEESQEAADAVNAVGDLLAGGLSADDDAAAEAELAAMEQEEADALAAALPSAPQNDGVAAAAAMVDLPAAPDGTVRASTAARNAKKLGDS